MSNISMKSLLEAGVHFGHQRRKWHPKMAKYIFGERNNIHIIDLQKTVKELKKSYRFMKDEISKGKTVLFVGTKRQAQDSIREEAERCNMYYINHRWLGGTLTNFSTIRKSVERLNYIEKLKASPVWAKLSKKEIARLDKELFKLDRSLRGIKNMEKLPDIIFIIDTQTEKTAILEGRKIGIPVLAIVDTDCDPDTVDIPIPGNDDAIRAIRLFAKIFADAVLEGTQIYDKKKLIEEELEAKENITEENVVKEEKKVEESSETVDEKTVDEKVVDEKIVDEKAVDEKVVDEKVVDEKADVEKVEPPKEDLKSPEGPVLT